MTQYLSKRIFSSILAITGLFVMVFFLARLTGDPGHLYLPIDAPLEVRKEFSEKHGFNDPIYIQFGKFLGDLTDGNLGYSLRNTEKLDENIQKNSILVTALVPVIGYDKSAEVAKEAMSQNKTIKEVLIEKNLISSEEINELLNIEKLI